MTMTDKMMATINYILSRDGLCGCGHYTLHQAEDAPDEFYCTNVECDVKFYVDEDGQAIDT